MTKLVNLRTYKPSEGEDVVYIGRGSIWGNPYSHKQGTKAKYVVKSRKEAIEKYREWILSRPDLLAKLKDLEGKTISCFCVPRPCHGDVLIELIKNLKTYSLF